MRNHRRAAHAESGYEGLKVEPVALVHGDCPDERLVARATHAWDEGAAAGRGARL